MARDLILGTAGHIDHGKTLLVKALTGIDCDRLPEEQQRGITIDIGFAHLDLGEYRLGIVDVPGHERFVKNMLAGATGIDLSLLVVAADDSLMPQTREHFEILKFLGVQNGVIALSKVDLVDDTTRQVVELEIRELVKNSFLADAPVVPVSAITGTGIPRLKDELKNAAKKVRSERDPASFRLPIDRAFTVPGYGTVVTGSVISGSVRVGDELDWHKADGSSELVRVRSLNNHGSAVEEVSRGQRAGVNLAGVAYETVRRGQELATPGYLLPSKVLTVRLSASSLSRKPLKHRLPVRLHIGTAEVMATVSLLDRDQLEMGQWGLAQLFLMEPVTTVWGQPFILRDSSAEHTLGGGQVVQPVAVKIRRRHVEILEFLERLGSQEIENRALAAAWFAGFGGVSFTDLIRAAGVPVMAIDRLIDQFLGAGQLIEFALPPNRKLLLHHERVSEIEIQVLGVLAALHKENPLATTHERQKTLARLDYISDENLLQAVTDKLIVARKVLGDFRRIARADFKPKLSANQQKLKDRIVDAHSKANFQPPEPKEFANHAGGNAKALKDIYDVAVAEGLMVKITDEIFLSAATESELRQKVTERLQTVTGLTVAEIRDLLGTSRKYAVPICEYLDRIGITHRNGDVRILAIKT